MKLDSTHSYKLKVSELSTLDIRTESLQVFNDPSKSPALEILLTKPYLIKSVLDFTLGSLYMFSSAHKLMFHALKYHMPWPF